MLTLYDALVEMERHKDILIAAQHERLVKQALGHDSRPAKAYQRWLTRLGTQLITWGSRLQTRYGQSFDVASAWQQECERMNSHSSPGVGRA